MKKVLVVAVHPDDETLGCGGTLLKHKNNGDEVSWLIVTEGSKELGFSDEFLNKRELQIKEVRKRYAFKNVYELGYLTTRLHTIDFSELIGSISEVINKVKPDIIYMNNRSDI